MSSRFYFPASTAAPVSPAFDGGWTSTTGALRRKLAHVKGSSAIAIGSTISMLQTDLALDRQYVSEPLVAGSVTASITIKGQLMTREFAGTDNVDTALLVIYFVSNDGSTVTGSILTIGGVGTVANEFINNATCRNNKIATVAGSTGFTTAATINAGDRLVVEIGYQLFTSLGTTPQAAAKYGENATDLAENDTATTDGAGWIEFSEDIVVAGPISGTASFSVTASGTLQGDAPPGTASFTVTASGTLTASGGGAIDGTAAFAVTASGTLTGSGALAGSAALGITSTGTLTGVGALAGTTSFSVTSTGTLLGTGALAGTAPLSITATGTLSSTGVVPIVGTATFSIVATATLWALAIAVTQDSKVAAAIAESSLPRLASGGDSKAMPALSGTSSPVAPHQADSKLVPHVAAASEID